MHVYKFNIVDYMMRTGHLSLYEHGVYRNLLDAYYIKESALDIDDINEVKDRLSASDSDVKNVLADFFKERDGLYYNKRCEEEIEKWNARGWRPHHPDNKPVRPPIDEWKETRVRIFERDNYTCSYCGQYGGSLECDHIYPVSRGGSNNDENLTTSCKTCNRDKGSKTVEEWRVQ